MRVPIRGINTVYKTLADGTRKPYYYRRGAPEGTWLHRMMERKPLMLVAVALANKMARAIWAMLTKKEDYRDPRVAAA